MLIPDKMTVQLNTEVFSPLDGFYLCAIYEERRLPTASSSTSDEALYKHTLVEYRFCRRTKLKFLRNSLLCYAVTLGRCALPSCKLPRSRKHDFVLLYGCKETRNVTQNSKVKVRYIIFLIVLFSIQLLCGT